jgi:hypothetical protein
MERWMQEEKRDVSGGELKKIYSSLEVVIEYHIIDP